jgi:hypothetical protein
VPTAQTIVGTFGGIEVESQCGVGVYAQIALSAGGARLAIFGTVSRGEEPVVYPVETRSYSMISGGTGPEHSQTIDVVARPLGGSTPWTRLDLHLDSVECLLSGTVIEAQAG